MSYESNRILNGLSSYAYDFRPWNNIRLFCPPDRTRIDDRMKWPLLTDTPFSLHTPESFYAYIKSLMKSNTSKEVSGVSIAVGKKDKLTIRISREEKIVTREELSLLAKEYKQDEFQLLKLFIKRKIGINYDNDNDRRESDLNSLAADKENARNLRLAMRKEKSSNKLLKPKRNTRLHEESSILTDKEPTLE